MTITAERVSDQQVEAPQNVAPLSPEQTALLGGVLLGLVPQLDALISDLRTYGFNEHTPKNLHSLERHDRGLKFKNLSDYRIPTTVEWHRVPRERIPASGGDTRPMDWFPVTMQEWHPTILPPSTQLIIPNVSEETLDAISTGMPYELTMAKVMTIASRRNNPALVSMAGPDTGASCDIVRPFAMSDDVTPDARALQANRYTSVLRTYVGNLASIGMELNVVSAEPLAERFLK